MSSPTFVDLFSGAGGLSLGLENAGWTCAVAIEHWADAAATYAKNFGAGAVWETDIEAVSREALFERLPEQPGWVVGGPPCQGFSTVGKRDRADPRNRMFLEFVRVVETVEPEGFILENVLGLKDMRVVEMVRAPFEALGYKVSFMVLKAADFGVPQLRRRVVFVGHREKYFLGPKPTHGEGTYVTVWDAIGDLPGLGPGQVAHEYEKPALTEYQRAMRKGSAGLQGHNVSKHPAHLVKAISFIPDGGNRRDIPDEYQPSSGFHNSYSRLSSAAPAVAVTSNMGKPSATRCIHPFQHRGLTSREGARLQSFPDALHFVGGDVSQRLQIANAVPPLLATALGKALLDGSRWTTEPATVPVQQELAILES